MIDLDRLELDCRLAIESGHKYLPATKIDTASDMIELITRLRQAEKDAARYRWLRDVAPEVDFESPLTIMADECGCVIEGGDYCGILFSDGLDAAIDEVMQCK